MTGRGISRRCLLAVGAVGIPGMALVACSQAASPEPAAGTSAGTGSSGGAGKPLAKLSDIKVGEAISATGPDGGDIVIVRPTESTVTAFSAICTHEGCTVRPAGQELDCPCHGSVFDLKGAVLNGPAQRPLRAVPVTLSGDDVLAG
jgi:Rieske Fe-S protein